MTINQRKTRSVVLLGGLIFLAFVSTKQFTTTGKAQSAGSQASNPLFANFDTGGKVPGNPANAVQDFQEIYRLIGVYKSQHASYPHLAINLWMDVWKNPEVYGYSKDEGPRKEPEAFWNPDTIHSASFASQLDVNAQSPYYITNQRPDGTSIEGAKLPGQKDMLAYTDIYVHQNIHHYPKSRTTENPVGFFVVLWDDGTVTQVPYDQQLYIPNTADDVASERHYHTYTVAFAGQAGVPNNALTYDQFYQQELGWKKGAERERGWPRSLLRHLRVSV